MTDPGRLRIKGYKIGRRLARGALSSIYLAHRGGRAVAIKVYEVDLDQEPARHSFRCEIASLTRLGDHPHVVELLDHGLTRDQRPFLVVPYFANGTLADRIERSGPLSVGDALVVALDLVEVLQVAHDASILHRDIKPSNILFDDSGEAMVGDFGIAVIELPGETTLSGAWVSPAYVAPEVIDGAEATTSSDLYSLGATLYAMLAGRPPFAGSGTILGQLRAAQALPVPPIERDDLPPELVGLVDDLLAKDPRDRPRTAADVTVRLRAIVDDYGFTRSTDPLIEAAPSRRLARRTLVATVLSLVVVVGAVTVGFTRSAGSSGSEDARVRSVATVRPEPTTPRTPMPSPPFGLVQPVVHDRGTDTTPRLRAVLDDVASVVFPTDWRRPNPTDSSDPGQYPGRFSYYFVNNRVAEGCTTFFGWEFKALGGMQRIWLTERTQASIKQFDSATDAHAWFTGMSVEFGADADECHGLPRHSGRPNEGPPSVLAGATVDHDDFPIEAKGFDEVNTWKRPSQVVDGFTDFSVVARSGAVTLLYLIVEPPGSDPTPRLTELLRSTPDALDRRLH